MFENVDLCVWLCHKPAVQLICVCVNEVNLTQACSDHMTQPLIN